MSDLAWVAGSVLGYLTRIGVGFWKVCKTLFTFNYHLVATCLKLLQEGVKAGVAVALAFGKACADICCNAVDILYQLFQAVLLCGDFIVQAVVLLFQLAIWLLQTLAWAITFLINIFQSSVAAAYSLVTNGFHGAIFEFRSYWQNLLTSLASIPSTVSDGFSAGKETGRDLYHGTMQSISTMCECTFEYLWQSLMLCYYYPMHILHHLWQWLYNRFENLFMYITDIGKIACSRFSNSINQLYDVFSFIPSDVYLTVTIIITGMCVLRMLIYFLNKRGLTVPFFQPHQTVIYLDGDVDIIDLSEEEAEDLDEDEITASSDTEESESEDIDDDDGDEFSIVDEDEFEGSESENDENDRNAINVHLPDRTARYTFRTRLTPSPFPSSTALSPEELQKRLELERDRRLCVVCQDQSKSVLVLPCRHMCMCIDCAHEIIGARSRQRRICPLCRSPIHTIMDVYV